MIKTIIETMESSKFKQYRTLRREGGYEAQINELDRERQKHKRKKNKKEKKKLLFRNTIDKMAIVIKILSQCFTFYKESYFESDQYRNIKILKLKTDEHTRL